MPELHGLASPGNKSIEIPVVNGKAAKAMACDAIITPIVTGDTDPGVLDDLVRLCVELHRWGWTLVLNKDGTTTAWNPDRTRILHGHGPPARAD